MDVFDCHFVMKLQNFENVIGKESRNLKFGTIIFQIFKIIFGSGDKLVTSLFQPIAYRVTGKEIYLKNH